MASHDRDRIAATAASGARWQVHARRSPSRRAGPPAQVAARETIIPARLGVRAGPDGGGERVPAVTAVRQPRPGGVLAVADLDCAGPRLPGLHPVPSIRYS